MFSRLILDSNTSGAMYLAVPTWKNADMENFCVTDVTDVTDTTGDVQSYSKVSIPSFNYVFLCVKT